MNFESNKFLDELTFGKKFSFFSLNKAQDLFKFDLSSIPFCYRLLLENLIRKSNSSIDNKSEIVNLIQMKHGSEIFFSPVEFNARLYWRSCYSRSCLYA